MRKVKTSNQTVTYPLTWQSVKKRMRDLQEEHQRKGDTAARAAVKARGNLREEQQINTVSSIDKHLI